MNQTRDYTKDLQEIRSIMEKSTRFLSISGWAGILAGIYAITGCLIAKFKYGLGFITPWTLQPVDSDTKADLISIALIILILSIITAIWLSYQKSKKNRDNSWSLSSKALISNVSIPLFAGGFWILILLHKGHFEMVPATSLVFYGLALYQAGNYTYKVLHIVGLLQIGLGLFCGYFVMYSLICWGLGFGLLHILYGSYIHFKYNK